MFHSRFNVDQPMRSSWQVVDALLRAVDLAALFVFQSEAYTCHREVSWVPAFRWWKTFTLTRKLTLCPGPSPYFLQEANFLRRFLLVQAATISLSSALYIESTHFCTTEVWL